MNVNKFCDNWQNCTIHKGDVINLHDFNRFRNDLEHFLRREQRDTYSSSSQLSRAISFSRSGNNNSTVFSRTRNLLYRCVHSAETSLLASSFPRVGGGGVAIPRNLSPDLPPLRPLPYSGKAPRLVSRYHHTEEKTKSRCSSCCYLNWQPNSPMNRIDPTR